jgi:hypothetical protein
MYVLLLITSVIFLINCVYMLNKINTKLLCQNIFNILYYNHYIIKHV